jgi:hypothetical protein
MSRSSSRLKRSRTVLRAGAFHCTCFTNWPLASVMVNSTELPVASMPPWQKAQLKPPFSVVSNIWEPRSMNLRLKSARAPSWRPGSATPYRGRAMATTNMPMRPTVRVRSSFFPSSSSSE